ncbi:MAG: RelA/SpoT domain-containing protein [Gemmatimonadaceae bacterium]|nr:RelA/SpoT domain-containing protein [Gemmatimonadaceae bacterium]MCW5827342.1 RelA/SpoT domain-containing protein [Gemmatimonadaceae bacterium]
MAWVTPLHSRSQVDAAGAFLATFDFESPRFLDAYEVLDNWRSAHALPLHSIQKTLRRRARAVYPHALLAQRLKRVYSTVEKLRRFPGMKLSRMQDIGGCRAVVTSVRQVRWLEARYLADGEVIASHKDYISEPKESGYRGVHLVYRYTSDQSPGHNGLLVELQVRSRLQHAWATAVETVGTFTSQSLKASEGAESWLRFFSLVSSAFAFMERSPLVPGTPTSARALQKATAELSSALSVKRMLSLYGGALNVTADPERKSAHYFLLSLNPSDAAGSPNSLEIRQYNRDEFRKASEEYAELERSLRPGSGAQAVLVAADSLKSLRRAYPSFFLDTTRFLDALDDVLSGPGRSSARVR